MKLRKKIFLISSLVILVTLAFFSIKDGWFLIHASGSVSFLLILAAIFGVLLIGSLFGVAFRAFCHTLFATTDDFTEFNDEMKKRLTLVISSGILFLVLIFLISI